jgi:hypothetical protein
MQCREVSGERFEIVDIAGMTSDGWIVFATAF